MCSYFSAGVPKKERDLIVRSGSFTGSHEGKINPEVSSLLPDEFIGNENCCTPPIPPPRSSSTTRQEIIAAGKNTAGQSGNGNGMVTHSGEGGSKIDIHVTVTVNPFSPGTLADLKKQRAMSRASQSSYTLAPASSTYSLSTPEYDRGSEFTASSVRVDTVSYRPPPSPSMSPRKYCGDPTEVIGGVDARSCCSLM